MPERLRTGAVGLDEVLDGGLPANAINLIVGLPGTGKTLLAQQCVFKNATVDRPAVYLSTVSEPFEKLVRYGQTLTYFDPDAVGQSVFYEDVGAPLLQHGVRAALERVQEIIDQRDPQLLVIDSFKPFAGLAESPSDYRRLLHEFAGRLSIRPLTSLWLGEYAVDEVASAPEFAIADAVVWLTSNRYDQREIRLLEVFKLRGSRFRSGKHSYRLSADGMRVFPRLADPADQATYEFEHQRISSGVESLDTVLGHGYRAGSSTLIVGPSGAGKTLFGLHFAFEGARAGGGTLLATFDENPSQIAGAAAGFGWSLDEADVKLMYRSAVDLHLDEWVHELLGLVEKREIQRVVIDGLGRLEAASHDPVRFQEYVYSMLQRFARRGVSLMMSLESSELFGPPRLTDLPLSQMADNVLLLQFILRDSEYRRAITVLKTRTGKTEPKLSEYTIGSNG
ncbi:MAG TPA: ATPase domain-containing protein, partial [Solirubrobacteraceae bacterium]